MALVLFSVFAVIVYVTRHLTGSSDHCGVGAAGSEASGRRVADCPTVRGHSDARWHYARLSRVT